MRSIFSILALIFLFSSCDDGDIITAELDFEDSFSVCGDLVCYKAKSEPTETLSLKLGLTLDELLETEIDFENELLVNLVSNEVSRPLSSTNKFNYRTYNNDINADNAFCSDIPPANLGITNDYVSTTGTANFIIELVEDDNDGVPAEFEDINGDGNFDNDDTDGDGLPNYLDDDDDGDNVKTASEMPNFSIELLLTDALDTDEDGIPNYLDTDDDNDGVPTINEESVTANQNPADDITNNDVGADYLNDEVTNNVPATAYSAHNLSQEFTVSLTLLDIDLPILTQDELFFGFLDDAETSNSRSVIPDFN